MTAIVSSSTLIVWQQSPCCHQASEYITMKKAIPLLICPWFYKPDVYLLATWFQLAPDSFNNWRAQRVSQGHCYPKIQRRKHWLTSPSSRVSGEVSQITQNSRRQDNSNDVIDPLLQPDHYFRRTFYSSEDLGW